MRPITQAALSNLVVKSKPTNCCWVFFCLSNTNKVHLVPLFCIWERVDVNLVSKTPVSRYIHYLIYAWVLDEQDFYWQWLFWKTTPPLIPCSFNTSSNYIFCFHCFDLETPGSRNYTLVHFKFTHLFPSQHDITHELWVQLPVHCSEPEPVFY